MSRDLDRLTAALADRYRIERELGQGGMATVYLAHDLRHDRQVAIKVLHPDLAAALGAERFLAEIKTTARLQHPHILPLLDSGAADGLLFYVMPYVSGETLRARLERERQLPLEDVLLIAREVADALGAAHALGIIHRDIKPDNILLQGGHAVVADFGIALAVQEAGGARMTQTGLSLGTPHYTSPEQAMGERTVDGRTDIYALGAVTYEMLVGEPPFTGPTAQAIIARVMTDSPRSLTSQRRSVPVHVEAAVLTALEKLPADRLPNAAAFASALADSGFRHTAGSATGLVGSAAGARWSGKAWVVTTAALALAAVGVVVGWALAGAPSATRDVGLPADAPMSISGWDRRFAVSADGSFLVYVAAVGTGTQLWRRDLEGPQVRPIAGTEGASGAPILSPDGTRVAFGAGDEFRVVRIDGGPVVSVARTGVAYDGTWLAEGIILLMDEDGRRLRWVDPETGPVRETRIEYCQLPRLIGGGDRLLCGGGADKYASVRTLAAPALKQPFVHTSRSAEGGTLLRGSDFRLVDDRYLIYLSLDGTLMGTIVRNLDSLTVGRSVSLVPMVRRSVYLGAGSFDLTADGTLVYAPGLNAEVGRLVLRSRDGRVTPLNVGPAAHLRFTPSPDDRRMATVVEGVQQQELRVYDLQSGKYETYDRGFYVSAPSWSPDGRRLVYRRNADPSNEVLLMRYLDSPEPPRELLPKGAPLVTQPSSYRAEDMLLIGVGINEAEVLLLDPTTTPTGVTSLGFSSFFASISPDRRWIAMQNQGAAGIRLQPWPARDRIYQVDAEGIEPRWRSSSELAFQIPGARTIYQVAIGRTGDASVGPREVITEDPRFADTPGWSFAFTSIGDLIYLQSPVEDAMHYVRAVPNWVAQMKRAVNEANR